MKLEYGVDPSTVVRVLFLVVACLAVAGLTGQISTYFLGDGHVQGFVPEFNLDREMNIPTWFSSVLFVFIAALLWRVEGPFRARWRALAAVFVFLSMDEVAALHEMAVDPIRKLFHAGGFLFFSWVVAGALFVAVLAAVYWKPVLMLPPVTRRLFILAAVLFLGGALGMEMIGGRYVQHHGAGDFTYALMACAEETLEMLGQVTFIKGIFSLLKKSS
jgi:hypothetical protein